ncbi:MAG TPA: ATP-binding protein [Stellaceae bacterium]|jgi:signal transduction histidine kinase|nr:ATP-binding protein [Stellaceae bacterium]
MLKRLGHFSMMMKVVIPTAVMLVVALGIVALAESGLSGLAAQTHQIINVTARREALSLAMTASVNGITANEKNAMLMTDKAGLDVFAAAYVTEIDHLKQDVAELRALAVDRDETRRLDGIVEAIDAYYGTGGQLYDLMVDRQFDAAHALSTGAAQVARERLIALIKAELDETSGAMKRADAQADLLYHRTVILVAGFSSAGLLIAFFAVQWITTRFIVRPLRRIADAMGRISNDDFTVAIEEADRADEIGALGRALKVFRARSVALSEKSTNLKIAHDEIRDLNTVLERRVEERTAALNEAHRELLAKARLSSIGELTASVAHELRNPLSTLRNTIHVIAQTAAAHAIGIERQLTRCWRTIDRCDGIVGDLLDFANNGALHCASLRLDPWLAALLDGVEIPPGIVLERRLAAPGVAVSADAERLRCAIRNVIENAIQAMADGAGLAARRITVSTVAGDDVSIAIADTGPGMPENVLARVFEPLFSTRAFGTGLGLPTVKQIVEQHGGAIDIASAPGSGTRIVLRLPARAAKEAIAA